MDEGKILSILKKSVSIIGINGNVIEMKCTHSVYTLAPSYGIVTQLEWNGMEWKEKNSKNRYNVYQMLLFKKHSFSSM